jgi:solute carrier family 25 phosphate transporter 23/24/25/41
MLRDEGIASFYYGLGPSLVGIAPYIAVNFCIFDLVKKSLPEEYRKKAQSSLLTAVLSAGIATLTCYPLDTVRRQMQMRGTPYKSIPEAFAGKLIYFIMQLIRARSSSKSDWVYLLTTRVVF